MSFTTYKQYDSRWGKKNYNGSSIMANAGCGPTACATLISGINAKITPINTMKYMQEHDYAIRNQGTAWAGIPACLKWGGYEDVHEVTTMDALWECLAKGNYKGIIRFTAGKRGGVCWTMDGHFVAFTAYKVKNGKHYLWMRDPGPRNSEKWYCYEDHMKGLVGSVWVGALPNTTPKKKTKLEKICAQAKKCAWPYGTKKSKCGYPKGKRRKAYKEALAKAFKNRSGWRRQTRMGASCDVYVAAVIRSCGVDKKFPRGCDDILDYMKSERGKKLWKNIKQYSWKKWKPGTVIFWISKSGAKHIFIYIGNGKVANAHYVKKTYPIIEKASKITKKKSNCKTLKVYVPR